MKRFKKIPKFKTEKAEAHFWDTHDSTEYIDWSKAKKTIFPNLKPSTRSIPIKFPNWLIDRLKFLATKHHTSYQSLLRIFVEREVKKEFSLLHKE